MKRHLFAVASVLILMLTSTCPAARGGIFTNGGFESPTILTNSVRFFYIGDAGLDGWTLGGTRADLALINGITAPEHIGPSEGSQYLVFNGGNNPTGLSISQTFDTKIGHKYKGSFSVAKLGLGPGKMEISAVVTSGSGTVLALATSGGSAPGWETNAQFGFVATTSSTTITLQDTSETTLNTDVALDRVSVEPEAPVCTIQVASFDICWKSFANTSYQIQVSSNVSTNTVWMNFGELVPGNGATNCVSVPSLGNHQFFRVVELP